jgi:hypothetical protein
MTVIPAEGKDAACHTSETGRPYSLSFTTRCVKWSKFDGLTNLMKVSPNCKSSINAHQDLVSAITSIGPFMYVTSLNDKSGVG